MPNESSSFDASRDGWDAQILGGRGCIETIKKELGRSSGSQIVCKTFRHICGREGAEWAHDRARFVAAIQAQSQAAASDANVPIARLEVLAPELTPDQPHTEAAYQRHYYSWSLLEAVKTRHEPSQAELLHIAERICAGLAVLRDECQRTHGNLKLENVLLDLIERHHDYSRARIVITDLASSLGQNEVQDLAQLGRILYQFIRAEQIPGSQIPLSEIRILPEGNRLTPKQRNRWTGICQRLLGPDQHDAGPFTFESFQLELAKIRKSDRRFGETTVEALRVATRRIRESLKSTKPFAGRVWESLKSIEPLLAKARASAGRVWLENCAPRFKSVPRIASSAAEAAGKVLQRVWRSLKFVGQQTIAAAKELLLAPRFKVWLRFGWIAATALGIAAAIVWAGLRFFK